MSSALVVRSALVSCCLWIAVGPAFAAAPSVGFERSAIFAAARALPVGGELRVVALPWVADGRSPTQDLVLERFAVFAPDARIVLHTANGDRLLPVPANVYLRGRLANDADSSIVLSVLESGEIRGLATSAGQTWLVGSAAAGSPLEVRAADLSLALTEAGGPFRCDLDDLGADAFRSGTGDGARDFAALLAAAPPARTPEAPFVFDHTAVIAIETDNEFLALGAFNNNPAQAIDYIADLIAYASTIYTAEVQTAWSLGTISLWGPGAADPWQQTSPACGLIDFGRYWNNNYSAVARTVTHFLSGKSTNSGIAWVGVLCSGAFNIDAAAVASGCSPALTGVSNWGGAYGYTSGIDGNFNIGSPSIVWDIMAFTHEIGHNFNSPHTHCYQNLGGNAAAIDQCYGSDGNTGCYVGATSLPAGCLGAGQNCGTIMSYCHLISPGMSNTSLTLGLAHPYGVLPARVPTRMRAHVVSAAAGNPACLALRQPLAVLFADGFHSHDTDAWSTVAP